MARQPQDPIVRDIVQMIRGAQLSRRQLLRGAAVGAAGAGTLGLASCAGGGSSSGDGVVWGNWTYYLDYDEESGSYPSLDRFMEESGYEVDYIEDIDDNNTFYGKIKDQLELGQYTGYDVVTFTDWMNGRIIQAEQVQEFDYANLPNVQANLVDAQWDALDVDPGRKFSIPWQLPASGWVWNTEAVPDGIKTLDDFLRPELKGKVVVLSEMRDTVGMILAGLGHDPSGDWGDAEFDEAMAWLDDALKSGQIGNVKGNSYTQDLISGDALAAMAWSGDVIMLNAENDNQWTLEIPESGGMIASDSFTVPNGTSAEAKARVEEMIDYYYQPEVMAEVADYVTYVPPVKGTQEAMRTVNPENADNPLIFPSEADWEHLHSFRTLSAEEDKKYSTEFQNVLGL
ncbi:spermidine/putrescine ABC transporter substrate-binding protein [Leucobacter allii]|uniref:Spermidine/putrescine ABC transporter substrate-binding protein n=1 Tax=Leucobacter allii TaxID=2932247 RepID=A0ABY4FPG4_9MICO|nr:spermidine/putrescine ABC transporter substrate-binding protein [Leucobacter allii]UOQ58171.1 spermidine/putrescine ABC transporter substrate-binding protein [Leucobacter allii]UOR02753.1 spermidine/putrescine ABC transporter substrate-binding protein [Leucobacter allii]